MTPWCIMEEPIPKTEKSKGFTNITQVFFFEGVFNTLRRESIPIHKF